MSVSDLLPCTLSPHAVQEPGKVVLFLGKSREGMAKGGFALPRSSLLGAAYYRAGRSDDAIREFGDLPALMTTSSVINWFFLAMAQHHSKDREQQSKARARLAQGVEQMVAEESFGFSFQLPPTSAQRRVTSSPIAIAVVSFLSKPD